jgi:toxin-antitoxin system PIN domain toxin
MTYAIDTDFLVAVEVRDHLFHRAADQLLGRLLDDGHSLGLTAQCLAEFIHVVTDPRRLHQPLNIEEAVDRAERWWQAAEVVRLLPDSNSTTLWIDLLRQHRLGRKRLLDTMLASTCRSHGIGKLISNNDQDFKVFEFLDVVNYRD